MDYIKKINENLTVIVSEGGALSSSFAIMVGTGSANENNKNNGISHYIEHMSFKGTNELSAFDISNTMEACGANFNAYTSVDKTCFYVQTLAENLEKTFSVMSSAVFRSTYPENEAEKEKQVIIEEINMSNDNPEDVCFDLACRSYFGDDGYGRTILGSANNVSSFALNDIKNYINDYYVAENICVTFAGNVNLKDCLNLVDKYILPYVSFNKKANEPMRNTVNLKQNLAVKKDIEQTHFCLTFKAPSFLDKDKIASETLTAIIGGGMSSRLFQKVREELGLAYSVYSFSSRYKDVGTSSIYAGVNSLKTDQALNAVLEVLERLKKDGVTQEEFDKVKCQIKSSTVFALERPTSKVQLFSRYYLNTGKLYDVNDRLLEVDNLTKTDVENAIKYYDCKEMSTAIVGKKAKPLKV